VHKGRLQAVLSLALSDQTSTCRLGLEVLSYLSTEPTNLRKLFLSGVMYPVLSLGAKPDMKLQEHSCRILQRLAGHPDNARDIVGDDARALRMLFQLGRHATAPDVRRLAVETQLVLASCKEHHRYFAEPDALEFYTHLAYSYEDKDQLLAARVVETLSGNQSLKNTLLDAGMLNVLIQLTRANNPDTMKAASGALSNLTADRKPATHPASPKSSPHPPDEPPRSDSDGGSLRVKCSFKQAEDEEVIRTLGLPRQISFQTLRTSLEREFGPVVAKYVDEDGDMVLLASSADLVECLGALPESGRPMLRLHLVPDPRRHRPIPSDNPGHSAEGHSLLRRRTEDGDTTPDTSDTSNSSAQLPPLNLTSPPAPTTRDRGDSAGTRTPIVHSNLSDARRRTLRWQKGQLLGRGAFGEVFEALSVDTGELMAVKQVAIAMDQSADGDTEMLEAVHNLEREIAFMRGLDHRHIVKYLGTEKSGGQLSIFLEFVSGGSIASLIGRYGALDEHLVRRYTRQTLSGLHYLHSQGIVHCDVKGGNLLVTEDGIVKLADFNSCLRLSHIANKDAKGQVPKGALLGTPQFMAPEVVRQQGHGKAADIWSLGCTVVQMLTGAPPWDERSNDFALMFQIASAKAPPTLPEGISSKARGFLGLCFLIDPKERPSAQALLRHNFVAPRDSLPHTSPRNAPAAVDILPPACVATCTACR